MQYLLSKSFRFALVYLMLVMGIDSLSSITELGSQLVYSEATVRLLQFIMVIYLLACILLLINWKSVQVALILSLITILLAVLFESVFAWFMVASLTILASQSWLCQYYRQFCTTMSSCKPKPNSSSDDSSENCSHC